MNLKFTQQHPVAHYILYFFCYELNSAIEAGGKYDLEIEQLTEDIERTEYQNSLGITVFRLNNEATNPDIALEKIKSVIESNKKRLLLRGDGGG